MGVLRRLWMLLLWVLLVLSGLGVGGRATISHHGVGVGVLLVLGAGGVGGTGVADDGAVLVELDAAGEGAGAGRGREGAAGGHVALLVVRVLF